MCVLPKDRNILNSICRCHAAWVGSLGAEEDKNFSVGICDGAPSTSRSSCHFVLRKPLKEYFANNEDSDEMQHCISVWLKISFLISKPKHVVGTFEPTKHLRHEISNNVVCATSKGSDQPAHMRSLTDAFSMNIKLLTEHHLEILSLKGGCTGLSESIHVKMPHCWKSHVAAHLPIIKVRTIFSQKNTIV